MKYNEKFENFVDCIDFTNQDPCVWIVFPPGAAGDLLSSIVNFHYGRTAAYFFGITSSGQVIFRPSDDRVINFKYLKSGMLTLDEQFINDVNHNIGNKNLNYSLLDQLIFSNHAWQDQQVDSILKFFPKAKIIRILPKNNIEHQCINWLASLKNNSVITRFIPPTIVIPTSLTNISDPRLLDIFFSDIISNQSFEQTYSRIIKHLGLEYKLIRFDFVQYWLNCQHSLIQPTITTLC